MPISSKAAGFDREQRENEIALRFATMVARCGVKYTIKREEDSTGAEIVRIGARETWQGKEYFEELATRKLRSKSADDPLPEPLMGGGKAVKAHVTPRGWESFRLQVETLATRLANRECDVDLDGMRPRLYRDPSDGNEIVEMFIQSFDPRTREVVTKQINFKSHGRSGYSEPLTRDRELSAAEIYLSNHPWCDACGEGWSLEVFGEREGKFKALCVQCRGFD